MEKLILSTRNPSKAVQIREMFAGSSVAVASLDEAGIDGEADEDGATLEENAEKKARFAWRPGTRSVADDTGVFIDALDGAPGVRSARWAGDGKTTDEIREFTLAQLADVPPEKRTATFRTVAVLIDVDGTKHVFHGEVRGTILTEPRGVQHPKMPYSAIFVPEGQTKTWAEMSTAEENVISHRGKAFAQVRAFLDRTVG